MQNDKSQRTPIILYSISALFFLLFLALSYAITHNTDLIKLDDWVLQYLTQIQHPQWTLFLTVLTHLGGVVANSLFAMAFLIFLRYKKWYKAFNFYLLSYVGALILYLGFKQLIARERPQSALIDVINYSFPSGHATLSMSTVLLVYFIIRTKYPMSILNKNFLLLTGITWALGIAFTRIYLHVHWLSDVVAGLALAIFWVTFIYLVLYRKKSSYI